MNNANRNDDAATTGVVAGQRDATNNAEQVKELGRKARARMQEERTKRSEIVRLDPKEYALSLPELRKKKSPKNLTQKRSASVIKLTGAPSSKKRCRPARKQQLQELPAAPNNADMWLPDMTQVAVCTSKENRSSVALLHGLPKGTSPSNIRRFFSGLDPLTIRILISCDTEIPAWDANQQDRSSSLYANESPRRIDRYPPRFRVVVKFDSAPTAELAADRSGETLELGSSQSLQIEHRNKDTVMRAAIGVTQMIKSQAVFILQKLSLEAKLSKEPLHESLSQVEQDMLPNNVHRILWMDAKRELKLSFQSPWQILKQGNIFDEIMVSNKEAIVVRGEAYQKLARQRNQLVQVGEEMRLTRPFPLVDLLDPLLEDDPVIHLSHEAFEVIHQLICVIDERLLLSRRRRFLLRKKERVDECRMSQSCNKLVVQSVALDIEEIRQSVRTFKQNI